MNVPLVLLSGLLSDDRVWAHQLQHLSNIARMQVVSVSQDTPELMVKAILDVAPGEFALAGHSMGGWLCLEVMKAAPARVRQLCLIDTTARGDSGDKVARRKDMIAEAKAGKFSSLAKKLADFFVYNKEVLPEVEKMFLDIGQEAFIRQEESMLRREECRSVLPEISCPTLVVYAAQDRVFSLEEHQELTDAIPRAKLVVIEGSGHMSPMEAPQTVTALLKDWLINFNP